VSGYVQVGRTVWEYLFKWQPKIVTKIVPKSYNILARKKYL